MFNQMPYDAGIAQNPGIWYGGGWGSTPYVGGPFMHNRYVFYEGWADWGAGVEITPNEMIGINVSIPYHVGSGHEGDPSSSNLETPNDAAFVYRAAQAQIDLKFDFGNIAISYDGGYRNTTAVDSTGAIYVYAGLNVIENLGIDIGFSYHLKGNEDWGQVDEGLPIGFGVGLKFTTDSFGIKFRTTVALAGDEDGLGGDAVYINSSVLPYYVISDNLAVFGNIGVGMVMPGHGADNVLGWYFNPYLRVGAEWGPSFYAGINVKSNGLGDEYADGKNNGKKIIDWSVPIALVVSF